MANLRLRIGGRSPSVRGKYSKSFFIFQAKWRRIRTLFRKRSECSLCQLSSSVIWGKCCNSGNCPYLCNCASRALPESRRLGRRGLQYEKAVVPRASWGLGVVAPGADGRMVFTFDKISLVKGQVFRMYFYEKGGARNLVVTVDGRDLNKAERL